MLDPDEEGASKLVKRIEKYALYYLNSADLREFEDYPGYFDTDHPIMMFHSHSNGLTMTAGKVHFLLEILGTFKSEKIIFAREL